MNRQELLAQAIVELAGTLVAEFGVLDVMYTLTDRFVDLLGVDAAGILVSDQRGHIHVIASSSHEARVVDLFALQNDQGPCLDCFDSGQQVVNVNGGEATERWPRFTAAASAAGYQSAHALPLHLWGQVLGAIGLLCSNAAELSQADIALGQTLADVAAISLIQERVLDWAELATDQS